MIAQAKPMWDAYWASLPAEERLRLSGVEAELWRWAASCNRGCGCSWVESMEALAAELEGRCRCGRRRERQKDSVTVEVLGERAKLPCTYFY